MKRQVACPIGGGKMSFFLPFFYQAA